ncbi:MAG: aldehyde dehydrogenase family protein, partial [Calditrichia bacterium]|nr:aldehyde dehydrogenase family protein [Calditrichia bacterium]
TVVFKAASETQKVGLAIKECIESAELPEGVFNYVNMPGRIAGDVFLETGIDKLFFTGSVPVGKYLMGKAAETLTPITLELGGNDAMIVCDDADIDRASSGAVWAGFQNSGQSCGGVERIYVHENIYESFLEKLKSKVQKLKVGYDQDYTIEMGAMTATRQIDVVNKHVEEAVSKGAIVFAKSNIPDDKSLQNFIPAIVLTGVDHSMLVMKEETFGPVVTVMKVKNNEEAIMLANDSDLGLTGSVWSKNSRKAFKIAKQIQAGSVTINDHLMSHGLAETAWGGFKESGIGRSHGKLGFDEMTQPQYIVNDILPFVKKNLWWPPYNQKVYAGIKGVMDMQYATSFGQRMKGIFNLLKIVMRMFKKD